MTNPHNDLLTFSARKSANWLAACLLLSLCLISTDSSGQAPDPEAKTPPVDSKLLLIGNLASSHVYTTFGYIGVVADNAQKDLYPPQRVDDLMQEVMVISDSLVTQIEALQKTELTEVDAKAVKEIIEIFGLLKQEADSLRAYVKDKSEANGNEFNRLRSETWTRVAKLLDIPVEAPMGK